MIFDIIFVRHGFSCANAWAHKYYGSQIFYHDPELTEVGIATSTNLNEALLQNIEFRWANEPYTIAASSMIRAQESAYYMIAKQTGQPINIFPHVAEKGFTADNLPFPIEDQRQIMIKRNPNVVAAILKGRDYRSKETFWSKSSWSQFFDWAKANPDAFSLGSDNKYRAVIFTHHDFLRAAFAIKYHINNNDAINTVIDTDKFTNKNSKKLRYEYWPLNHTTTLTKTTCPDECLHSVCSAKSRSLHPHPNTNTNMVNTTLTRKQRKGGARKISIRNR